MPTNSCCFFGHVRVKGTYCWYCEKTVPEFTRWQRFVIYVKRLRAKAYIAMSGGGYGPQG